MPRSGEQLRRRRSAASPDCGWRRRVWHWKRRVPPLRATLMQPEESSVSDSRRHAQMSKVWFITGTSKGFGRIWAEAALERGDRVVATARNAVTLTALVERYGDNVLALTARRHRQGRDRRRDHPQPHEHFGRLDVVVNNAGYGLFGEIEEVSEAAGPRADRDEPVRRAVGHAGGAPDHARAGLGPHHPGVVDRRRERVPDPRALPRVQVGARGHQPVAGGRRSPGFGIKVTIVEPAGFSTDWSRPVRGRSPSSMPEYARVRE